MKRTTPGYRLKFERAKRHFQEASELLAAYIGGRPYAIRRDENPQTGLTFWITLKTEPPDEIALAVGDCIHNLRSALDHIIYELSCHHRQMDHVGATGFPIYGDAKDWDAKDSKGTRKTSSGLYKLRAIPDSALRRIEELQPYKGLDAPNWQRARLLQVHELDIADKHRNLNLAVANVRDMGVFYGHDGPQLAVVGVHRGRLVQGRETLLLRFDPSVDLQAQVQPDASLEVIFADSEPFNRASGLNQQHPIDDWHVETTTRNLVVGVVAVLSEIETFF